MSSSSSYYSESPRSNYSRNRRRNRSPRRKARGGYDDSSFQELHIKELNMEMICPTTRDHLRTDKDPDGHKIVVIGKPGCFAPGTEILMYDGTVKRVENVVVGDQIMGPDSTPRAVLQLCRNEDEMFNITPKRGESYTVNLKHKLVLKSCGYHKIKKGTVIEMTVEDYLKKPKSWRERWCVFRTGVDFPTKKTKIDPYLLGLWIGDGTKTTSEFTTVDDEILNYLQDYCKDNENCFLTNKTKITYRIRTKEGTKGKNPFLNFLRENDLIKNKHIPDEFKINDRQHRLSLLAGLIDTDGYYDKKGNGYDIIQKRERIIDDIVYIARSLGFYADKRECIKSCKYKGKLVEGTYYRTFITGNIQEIPCKILRKKASPRKCNRDPLVSRFSVVPQGKGQYYGFTVDKDHRFLLGSFDVVRNTGKTTLIADILYAKKHIIPVGMVMSGSEDSNGFYRKMFPSTFVYNKYDEEQIENFIKRQKLAKHHLPNPWAVCLLDDCTDQPAIFRKPLQQGMYKRGRHWRMLYILSLQYCMDVLPVIRTTVDGVFILRETNLKNRRSLYENYAGIIPDFKMFCEIMDQITDDYTALYIHNAIQTNDWRECIYWYKARPVPDGFKFGCPDYWAYHFDRYNPEYVDPFY